MKGDNSLLFNHLRLVTSDQIRGNFVRLPTSVISVLESTNIPVHEFGVLIQPGSCYVGWDGHESRQTINGEPVIEINPVLAQDFQLKVGQIIDIQINHYNDSLVASEVFVEPETSDDWEIIESNAMFFQDEMLFQTRIVNPGGKLVCYVDRIVARFNVKKVVPENLTAARISTNTMMIIAPRVNNKAPKVVKKPTSLLVTEKTKECKPIIRRTTFKPAAGKKLTIELSKSDVKSTIAYISILQNPLDLQMVPAATKEEGITHPAKRIAVDVKAVESLEVGHIRMSLQVWNCINGTRSNGEKIKIEFLQETTRDDISVVMHKVSQEQKGKKVVISGVDTTNTVILQNAEALAKKLQGAVITNRLFFPREMLLIELKTKQGNKIDLFRANTQKDLDWKLSKHEVEVPIFELSAQLEEPGKLVALEKMLDDMVNSVCSPVSPPCHYLYGSTGIGKSLLLANIAYRLQCEHGYHTNLVDCNSLLDTNNVAKMKQKIQHLLATAYWKAPSVVILDNADFLFPSLKSNEEAGGPGSGNTMNQASAKLAHILMTEMIKITQKRGDIHVIMSAERSDSLNPLFSSRHFIGRNWVLKAPSRIEREMLLEHLFSLKSLKYAEPLNSGDIALETEGYSAADLETLVDKIFHETLCKGSFQPSGLEVDRDTFESALKGYTSSSLRGIKLQKSTGVKWSDIGALSDAKNLLLETLEWPTKYAPIFSQCPLRLRSGILLYGFPGCGKTMLASAVAQQCGLNFITVKGPEILNKYIGASEQSVRELFEKAQAAKPCVLFFDEFDSIAPKRGHDSTGVTDRVVNQMLTQMDGAEGLDGVYVLAATSRPDLIDSALLRPGRLDKSVLCGMPTTDERAEILKAVVATGSMKLDSDIDLKELAAKTTGFSGADLQSMCYNAYLKAVHRNLQTTSVPTTHADTVPLLQSPIDYVMINAMKSPSSPVSTLPHPNTPTDPAISRAQDILCPNTATTSESTPVPDNAFPGPSTSETGLTVSCADMLAACAETKPSISSTEYLKLNTIYRKFVNDRNGDMPSGEAPHDIGARATLM
ncbi:AAA family ATPase peroxin 1 Ecym_3161 [Eremothecium cymbalariae DBVPG|uniref:Peroxisomal ATPase PEX1 n=1 Tax=Eremothecium cymbalariae (strain CBS 270.75 / DBVPG 7215 / KCTC 17166 / NRRL Y-17582) TaxID=931890 RepID=G8JR95_ERECY|nr:Hypothetical protein Ecym_3161 [Eremothecium cymbalariae DBVPG\